MSALPAESSPGARFARFAWAVLAYTLGVILFGAVVRITGSGAGCGQHWPSCQGELLLLPSSTKTAIEYGHRLTSGLNALAVVALVVFARRTFPRGHAARTAAMAALVFMVVEALIGAVLVRRALVAENASAARAVVMAAHLVNTSFLTATLTLTAWSATRGAEGGWMPSSKLGKAVGSGLLATLIVSVTGAITALGDTLYPVDTSRGLAERLAADHSSLATFLERGRAIHPLVAFLGATLLLVVSRKVSDASLGLTAERAAQLVRVLVFLQLGAGALNVLLSAPGYMQVIHLAIATALWIALVVLHACVRSGETGG